MRRLCLRLELETEPPVHIFVHVMYMHRQALVMKKFRFNSYNQYICNMNIIFIYLCIDRYRCDKISSDEISCDFSIHSNHRQ